MESPYGVNAHDIAGDEEGAAPPSEARGIGEGRHCRVIRGPYHLVIEVLGHVELARFVHSHTVERL